MLLTKEQEAALMTLINAELAAAPLREALAVKEAELAEVETRYHAAMLAVDLDRNDAYAVVNAQFAAERADKMTALADTKKAIEDVFTIVKEELVIDEKAV